MRGTSLVGGEVTIQRKRQGQNRLAFLASEAVVMLVPTSGPNGPRGRKTTQAETREITNRAHRSLRTEGRRCRAIGGRPTAKRGGRPAAPGLSRRAVAPAYCLRLSAPKATNRGGILRPILCS